MFYWITDITGQKGLGCVRAHSQSEAAAVAQEKLGDKFVMSDEHRTVWSLPYPAFPPLNDMQGHPDFCINGNECKGKTSCPRDYACSE